MRTFKVIFKDFKDIEFDYVCKANSPVTALVKAEEALKLFNFLDMDDNRDIKIKMIA